MASSDGNDGAGPSKRTDEGDRSNTSILSKKKRFTNKRVSFAEALDVHEFNAHAVEEYFGDGMNTDKEAQSSGNDARARLAFDDEGEDTAPLGGPPSMNPADSMDLYNHSEVTTNNETFDFDQSPIGSNNQNIRMSANFNFDDDGVKQSYVPRFSIMHQQESVDYIGDDDDDDDMTLLQSDARLSAQSKIGSEPRQNPAIRPSLPEKRQLFSGDVDETIHFKVPPATSSGKPPISLRSSRIGTPLRAEKRSRTGQVTPSSALGRQIKEAAYLRSTGKSTSKPSVLAPAEQSARKESVDVITSMFPLVEKFLNKTEFKQASQLGKSETEEEFSERDFDLATSEGRIIAGVMKECFYDRLNSVTSDLTEQMDALGEEIKTVSVNIENKPPEIMSRYTTDGQMKNEEKATVEVGLSRLKRCIRIKTRTKWCEYQSGIERDICESSKKISDGMENEMKVMKEMADRMAMLRERMEEELKDVQLPGDDAWAESTSVPVSTQLASELRNNMRERYTLSRTHREEKNKEDVIRERIDEVDQDVRDLEKECGECQKRIAEGPMVTIRNRNQEIQKRRDLFASLTGIRTRSVKNGKVVFCISNLADLTVCYDGNMITDLSVEYVPPGDGVLEPIKNLLEDAVMLSKTYIVKVAKLEQLRIVLFLLMIHLENVKRTGLAVSNYIDAHGIEFDDVEIEDDAEYSQLRLKPSFFSSHLGIKFKVILALKFFPPVYDGEQGKWELPRSEIHVCEVQEIVDTPPSLQVIEKIVLETEGDICEKLKKVWDIFESKDVQTTPMEIST